MQILIIEDETRAANQLQSLLKECDFSYQLLDILDTVEDAIDWFGNNAAPDLVFLDIQLADGLSFEIFQETSVEAPIIFTTAFDQYAIQAFKVNSIDYLLKPIQRDDLQQALSKFTRSNRQPTVGADILKGLLDSIQTPVTPRKGILVKQGSGFTQLKIDDLLYLYSEDSVTFGITSEKRFIIDETLDQLYPTLDPHQFFRINRAQIVARHRIDEISPYFNHRLKLNIQNTNNQEFIVSRPKTKEFKQWLNG